MDVNKPSLWKNGAAGVGRGDGGVDGEVAVPVGGGFH